MGQVQAGVGRTKDAVASFEQALELDPEHYEVLWRLADLRRDAFKDLRGAWELSDRALKSKPDGIEARRSRCATSLVGGGPPTHAADILVRCKKAQGDSPTPWSRLLLARALQYAGDTRAADKLFAELVAESPDDETIKGHYIGLLGKTGRIPKAVQLQRELLAAAPDDEQRRKNMVGLLFMLADGHLRASDSDKACHAATEAYGISQAAPVAKRVRVFCGRLPKAGP